jgi:hypothetical protein
MIPDGDVAVHVSRPRDRAQLVAKPVAHPFSKFAAQRDSGAAVSDLAAIAVQCVRHHRAGT